MSGEPKKPGPAFIAAWQLHMGVVFVLLASVMAVVVWRAGFGDHLWVYIATTALALVLSLTLAKPVRPWLEAVDWRVGSILYATLLSVVASLVIYAAGLGHDPSTFFGAIFAAWLGAVAFFVVVGVIVAVVSLTEPFRESFDSRARILLRNERGSHIDYIVDRLKYLLGYYSVRTENRIVVSDYYPQESKYRISMQSRNFVRNYINDIVSTFISKVQYNEITPPPPAGLPNRLVYVRIDGKPAGTQAATTGEAGEAGENINYRYTTTIGRDSVVEISYRADVWFKADSEELSYSAEKYVQTLTLDVENNLSDGNGIRLRILTGDGGEWSKSKADDDKWIESYIGPGDVRQICAMTDVKPVLETDPKSGAARL